MNDRQKAIIVDLDGTMCNTDHRQHLVEAKKWDAFYEALDHDPINKWCDDLVFAMTAGDAMRVQTIFVSGRPEKYRTKTENWFCLHWGLEREELLDGTFRLYMRGDGDFRKDSIVKEEIYRSHIEQNYEVMFCIDDRKQVVDMWRSIGLVCLQCAEGDF